MFLFVASLTTSYLGSTLLAPSLLAQNATTSLRGVIKDPTGAVVPGAAIVLLNKSNGQQVKATSSGNGEYQLTQIPPAKYTITVVAAGFGPVTKTAELLVDQPATINFVVSLQASVEVINVSGEAQTLNITDASLGGSANNAEIQALPSETRNVPDLLSLQPGVLYLPTLNSGTDSRSGSVNGGRSDQGNVTLDGVDDNNQTTGRAFEGVLRETQDSIEEFRVTTGNSNADAGRSSGAQVSLVTKSGTNSFHGALYEYHRPTFTVANDWFNKQAEEGAGLPNVPGKLIRNIFGGAIGGPVLKDKIFFFGNYEGSRLAENTQVNRTTPTASYKLGELAYQDANGDTQTLTAAQVAQLDSGCAVCNTSAYTPGPGPNPNALAYFSLLPTANGSTLGDSGLTTGSYSFSSPSPSRLNTTIVRLDYDPSSQHRLFVRGNLQKDITDDVEQFPGQAPNYTTEDNTKGITAGDTWTISSSLVNDIRYGYIRQGFSKRGIGAGDYVDFRFIDTATGETRTTVASVPVNNIVDNLSWTKGRHSISVGGNWRLVHQNHSSDLNSYNSASSNPYWLGGGPPDPATLGLPTFGNENAYQVAFANLVGVVPSVTDVYNYNIDSPTGASLLPEGAFLKRHFKANEFEYYLQDSWRIKPNLTLTFGMRHTILQTPYETTGQEIAPTIDTHAWSAQREASALQGIIYEPDLQFAPAGPHYNKPGYWPKSKTNIAPRFAVAYSPDPKTSFRAGAGIYYDHYGEGLVNAFDAGGSFGVSSSVTNQASVLTVQSSPRFTNRTTLPFNNGAAPASQTFPFTAPVDNFAITTGLDSRIKTPYSESFDLSMQHEFPAGLTFELAYVGRLGRHLLQNLDLAEPTDFVDPAGGGDYYTAGAQLSKLVDVNGGSATASVAPIKYFEDIFPWMANFDFPGQSATQAIYSDEWAPFRTNLGATTALADLDFFCYSGSEGVPYPCPANHQPTFWQDQFASLFSLSSMGTSSYHAAQFTLRHPSSHGLQFDVNYTFSKSLDLGSDTESNGFTSGNNFSIIHNTWKPKLDKGPSDFDVRSLFTADFVYQLPIGRGKQYLGNSGILTEVFLGGWQLSGIARATSALPFSLAEPGYTTNWTYGSYAVTTAHVQVRKHLDANGDPQYFDNSNLINSGTSTGSPVRFPYPGEAGERNNFRGDGYFNLDDGLAKSWRLERYGALKFAWEVYNVTNSVRFDPASIGGQLTSGNVGVASKLLTQGRRMQFSLRYDF